MPTFWSGGRKGDGRRLAAGLVLFVVWGSLATNTDASVGPEPPPGTHPLLEYSFDTGDIVGDWATNVLDTSGWLDGELVGGPGSAAGSCTTARSGASPRN